MKHSSQNHESINSYFILFYLFFNRFLYLLQQRRKLLTILILDTYPNYSTILYSYERHATYNEILT